MATKTCKRCKQSKPLTDFYKAKYNYRTNTDGHDYYCKYCRTGTHLKSRLDNKHKCSMQDCERTHYAKTYCRPHYERFKKFGEPEPSNQDVHVEKEYKYDKGIRIYKRDKELKRKYKISLQEFNDRSVDGCELCGNKPKRNLHVDHDHNCCPGKVTCGECVRGIICNRCNAAVDKMEKGIMRPDYYRYQLIEQYLEKYGKA